jgi:hypothetical protein
MRQDPQRSVPGGDVQGCLVHIDDYDRKGAMWIGNRGESLFAIPSY